MREKAAHRGAQRRTEGLQKALTHTPRIIAPADGGPDLSELQPCPRCGARAQLYGDLQPWMEAPRYYVKCPQCGARGMAYIANYADVWGRSDTAEQAATRAADAWNAGTLYDPQENARKYAEWGKANE